MSEKIDIDEQLEEFIDVGFKNNSNEDLANELAKKLKLKNPKYDLVVTALRRMERDSTERYSKILDLIYSQIDSDTKKKLKSKLQQ
ncbi:hypothetical protein AZI11_13430 (plasmid) [Levilactobacillus brevis]|uniref:hypothetical protein n=1 Tax=Levilactobacillus brevis TaxID=1580 RepID=UPI00057E0324|nr:hypothetical protein [Levilactobacillus brevis]ARN93932.1 hypothetical protein AZI11_13430 [Levilactobacillus brevis]ARN96533.1 hypothetical protein AZI12_13655 [Levilactobacillus brevis]